MRKLIAAINMTLDGFCDTGRPIEKINLEPSGLLGPVKIQVAVTE